jgi:elongation factor Ts
MAVDLKEIKRLRDLTGVGMTDAKKALDETNGDFDKALAAMRKKGLTKAEKKGEREAREGLIEAYVHSGRIGVLVEVNCETDFVTRTDDFKSLAHDIALHVAAAAPEFVSIDEVPDDVRARVAKEFEEKSASEGKPADMIKKIVDGQLQKYFAEKSLLDQAFIKNPDQTVGEYVKEHIAKLGENIVVRRFSRLVLGEIE